MGNKVAIEEQTSSKNYVQEKSFLKNIFTRRPKRKFVLGIIDPQNDFCEGGSLAVFDANKIFPQINKLRYLCLRQGIKTFISQDYHPASHMSFASTYEKQPFTKITLDLEMENNNKITVDQMLWPIHCVENTLGANFHKDLFVFYNDKIIQKGTKHKVESYSAFGDEFGNQYENTGLNKWLTNKKITDIILVGLATDYCVYNTAKDAINLGYSVHLILSCVRGVDSKTTEIAMQDMKSKGVIMYADLLDFLNFNKDVFTSINIYL